MKKTYLILILMLSSCATIFSGTTQSVNVVAVDEQTNETLSDARCSLTTGQGVSYIVPSNPGSVKISRSSGGITPICKKAGYTQKNFGVGDKFNAASVANILFWPGFIVDAMSGAMHKYPSHITVFMEPIHNK